MVIMASSMVRSGKLDGNKGFIHGKSEVRLDGNKDFIHVKVKGQVGW